VSEVGLGFGSYPYSVSAGMTALRDLAAHLARLS
jgi:hypothetical protein